MKVPDLLLDLFLIPRKRHVFFFFFFFFFKFTYLLDVVFGTQQMVLPCGSQVRIFAEVEAFGHGLHLTSDSQRVVELEVQVWREDEVCLRVFFCFCFFFY